MEEKFSKKFEVFFSLRLIDRVITCCNQCINRPEIAFLRHFRALSHVFRTLKMVSGEENGEKILKKI